MVRFVLTLCGSDGADMRIGSADSYAGLPWAACSDAASYTVWRNGKAVVEFAGGMTYDVRAWLSDNPGFDGSEGSLVCDREWHFSGYND